MNAQKTRSLVLIIIGALLLAGSWPLSLYTDPLPVTAYQGYEIVYGRDDIDNQNKYWVLPDTYTGYPRLEDAKAYVDSLIADPTSGTCDIVFWVNDPTDKPFASGLTVKLTSTDGLYSQTKTAKGSPTVFLVVPVTNIGSSGRTFTWSVSHSSGDYYTKTGSFVANQRDVTYNVRIKMTLKTLTPVTESYSTHGDWPVVRRAVVFSNQVLESRKWSTMARASKTIPIDTELLIGMDFEYTIRYIEGTDDTTTVRIYWRNKIKETKILTRAQTATGITQLPSQEVVSTSLSNEPTPPALPSTGPGAELAMLAIMDDADVMVESSSSLFGVTRVIIDLSVILGYSGIPATDTYTPEGDKFVDLSGGADELDTNTGGEDEDEPNPNTVIITEDDPPKVDEEDLGDPDKKYLDDKTLFNVSIGIMVLAFIMMLLGVVTYSRSGK